VYRSQVLNINLDFGAEEIVLAAHTAKLLKTLIVLILISEILFIFHYV
jgi:hypothetical protein